MIYYVLMALSITIYVVGVCGPPLLDRPKRRPDYALIARLERELDLLPRGEEPPLRGLALANSILPPTDAPGAVLPYNRKALLAERDAQFYENRAARQRQAARCGTPSPANLASVIKDAWTQDRVNHRYDPENPFSRSMAYQDMYHDARGIGATHEHAEMVAQDLARERTEQARLIAKLNMYREYQEQVRFIGPSPEQCEKLDRVARLKRL